MIYIKADLTCLETLGNPPADFDYVATIDDATFDKYGGVAGAGTLWKLENNVFVGIKQISDKRICRLRNTYFEVGY